MEHINSGNRPATGKMTGGMKKLAGGRRRVALRREENWPETGGESFLGVKELTERYEYRVKSHTKGGRICLDVSLKKPKKP